jgi:malate synthase
MAGKDISEADLLELRKVPKGEAITSVGLQKGVSIVLAYTEAWLRGVGCIPLNHHMEDAATAEISRAQIWQWRYHEIATEDDGVVITSKRISKLIHDEVKERSGGEDRGKWFLAGKLVEDMLTKDKLDDFLTTVCYPHILTTKYEGDVIPEDEPMSKL